MKIFINTLGTRGDVQPFVALGKGLQAAGHTVTICTSASFEPFITEHGLNYGYMTDDFMKLINSDAGREAMERTTNIWETLQTYRKLISEVGPMQKEMLEDSWQAAEAANPDLIIFHPKSFGGVHFAEKLNIPAMMALTIPMYVPTAERPTLGFPELNIGGWYNRGSYKLLQSLTALGVGRYAKWWRKEHGLPNQPRGVGFLEMSNGATLPVIHPISPSVYTRPSDWPDYSFMEGFWFLDQHEDWQPPAALEAFLASGEAPVYVGFGSMSGRNPEKIAKLVIEALQKANVRGVIATGWGGLKADDLPETIFQLDKAPHDWLFPRMAAVVHHGGAGTTAAGLRAGRPTIICPFIADQPMWGKQVQRLGVGTAPIPQKQLTAEKLAVAIREVTTNQSMQQKAVEIGEKIRAEDGVAATVTIIEQYMAQFIVADRAKRKVKINDELETAPST